MEATYSYSPVPSPTPSPVPRHKSYLGLSSHSRIKDRYGFGSTSRPGRETSLRAGSVSPVRITDFGLAPNGIMSTASVSSGRNTPIWKDFFGRRASVSDLSTPSLEKLRFRNTMSTLRESRDNQPRGPVTIEPKYVSSASNYSSTSSGYSSGSRYSSASASSRYTPSSSASSSRYSSTSSAYTPDSTSSYTGSTFSYRQPRSTYSSGSNYSTSNSYSSNRTSNSVNSTSSNKRLSAKEKKKERDRIKDEEKEAKKKSKEASKAKKVELDEKAENEKNGDIPPPAPLKEKKKSSSLWDLRKKFSNKFGSWFSEDDHSHNYHEKTIKLDRRHSVAEISDEKVKKEDLPQVRSILKRHDDFCPSYRQTPSLSSNRREGPVCLKKAKKCQFKPQMDVIFYAQTDKTTKHLAKEQKQLQEERETSSDVTEGFIQVNCKLHPGKPCMGPYWYRTRPGYASSSARFNENNNLLSETDANYDSIYKGLEIDIVLDENNIARLKLFVPILAGFVRNRTSVKAMSGGKKLIIIAYKLETDRSGKEYLHQYLEKLHLPHPIDAYSVRATMDKDGNLKIDAPNADS